MLPYPTTNKNLAKSKQSLFLGLSMTLLLWLLNDTAFAVSTTGGGLPFDDWMTKITNSITGPFAFAVSIIGLVGAGAALIFGGDMNGVLRTLLFIVLVLSLIIAAKSTLSSITGQGAEISFHAMPKMRAI